MNKLIKTVTVLAVIAAGIFLIYSAVRGTVETEAEYDSAVISAGQEYIEAAQNLKVNAYCFRNEELLNSHFEKHGRDMGFATPGEYEIAASAVATNPASLHKTEKEDGDDVYYLEETNEFVIISTDGYIRTYFYPDAGKAYFDRQ